MDAETLVALVQLVLAVAAVAGLWGVFVKAGKPGWLALIPFYNFIVLCRVAGTTGWMLLLMFIPLVNLVALFYVSLKLSKAFGKGAAFAVGLTLLGFAFLPILALDQSRYLGGPGEGAAPSGAGDVPA